MKATESVTTVVLTELTHLDTTKIPSKKRLHNAIKQSKSSHYVLTILTRDGKEWADVYHDAGNGAWYKTTSVIRAIAFQSDKYMEKSYCLGSLHFMDWPNGATTWCVVIGLRTTSFFV